MADRMSAAEREQEIVDLKASLNLLRAEVALKLQLGDRQKSHFYKLMAFADWLATGWEYFQKLAVVVGIAAGLFAALKGWSWFGK